MARRLMIAAVLVTIIVLPLLRFRPLEKALNHVSGAFTAISALDDDIMCGSSQYLNIAKSTRTMTPG